MLAVMYLLGINGTSYAETKGLLSPLSIPDPLCPKMACVMSDKPNLQFFMGVINYPYAA